MTELTSSKKITPYLWFDGQAEEAANFYVSIFKDAKITAVSRYGPNMPFPEGTALVVSFQLEGQQFCALNGGPQFQFNEAISLFVDCQTQDEMDMLWNALTEGGEESQCGWLKDKYGVSWQIVPAILGELMQDEDAAKAQRVVEAMLQMSKIDIGKLMQAAEGTK